MDIDFGSYFDFSHPALRGSVAGGVVNWFLNGGMAKFGPQWSTWKGAVSSLTARVISSVAVGLPLELVMDLSGIDILIQNKMIAVFIAIQFVFGMLAPLEEKYLTTPINNLLNKLPFGQ